MLEDIVVGWEEIESLFLVNIALNKPFILLGKHGTSKTTCAKEIAKIYGRNSFRFYDATKDDLVSIAGIPIPQKLAQGRLEFSRHDRSIWQAKVIVIDELTRANRENQNLWLEILEEKSCFGKKLNYEALIATMNPESYAATFKLDEALLDRFYAVVPVPDLQKGTTSSIFQKVIQLNLKNKSLGEKKIKGEIAKIKQNYKLLINNQTIVKAVSEYVANYIEVLLGKVDNYISPRKTVHLFEEIIALASYYKKDNEPEYLVQGAKKALLYVLGIPFKIKPEILNQIHHNLKQILTREMIDAKERIRIELAKMNGSDAVIEYLKKNSKRIETHLPFDETEKLLIQAANECKDEKLLVLQGILKKFQGHEEPKRIVESRAVLHCVAAVRETIDTITRNHLVNDLDFQTLDSVKKFILHLKRSPQDKRTERFLFSNKHDKIKEIISFVKKGGFDGTATETDSGVQ